MALLMLAACLVAPLAAQPAELLQPGSPAPQDTAVAEAEAGADRDAKLFSVFQIVKFKNGVCPALDGTMGTCFTEAECSSKGGVSGGSCASGFGVCCVFTVSECGSTVTENNTYIQSPGYPASAPLGMCMYSINKCDADICQFRIEFELVELGPPVSGSCNNDTVTITGVDANSMKVIPMGGLCGELTGQHMIVNVKEQTAPGAKIVFNTLSGASRWRIRVTQIACEDTALLAPAGCLTYNTEASGNIASYNGMGGTPELLNDQKFSHCIKQQDGFCDVALTASSFDLDSTGDSLTFGSNVQSGTTFGVAGALSWNFTGPYVVTSCSNDDNAGMTAGYDISYLLLPC